MSNTHYTTPIPAGGAITATIAAAVAPPKKPTKPLAMIRPSDPSSVKEALETAGTQRYGLHAMPNMSAAVQERLEDESTDRDMLIEHAGRAERPSHETVEEWDGLGPTFTTVVESDGTTRRVALTKDQRIEKFNRSLFARALAQERQSVLEFLPYRIRAAWRIVRELVRQKGLGYHDDPLSDVLMDREIDEPAHETTEPGEEIETTLVYNPDPWVFPSRFVLPKSKEKRKDLFPEVIELIKKAERLPRELSVQRWDGKNGDEPVHHRGFAILPPPVPPKYVILHENGAPPEISEEYTDEKLREVDPNLDLWLQAVQIIVLRLGISLGTANDPDSGRLGVYGLVEPQLCRLCWPTRTQIIAWEYLLVEETLDLLIKTSVHGTKKALADKYGFNQREQMGLIRQATLLAKSQAMGDREEARAIMALKLEDYCRRSREALDLKAEMNGLKQLSIIQGLSDAQHNDPMTDFINAVRMVSREKSARRPTIDTTAKPALPAGPA